MAIDGRKSVVLVLLYLSAAFDTIDHGIMWSRLERPKEKHLAWFDSYLPTRFQCISVEEALSEVLCLLFGMQQGLILGPLLFIIYTLPLFRMKNIYGIQIHTYANDTQLYVSYGVTNMEQKLLSVYKLHCDIQS